MSVILECIGCRTEKEFPEFVEYPVCPKCKEWEIKHHQELDEAEVRPAKVKPEPVCSLCGYKGPAIDRHHIHGRKNSDEIIIVCANCHREIHAGTRVL
jgi:ssDNA-binding Zn-finger/Zn-ribbon topoisomerase 1